MAFSVFSVVVLFFPAALLFGGAYLVLRGLAKRTLSQTTGNSTSGTFISGPAASPEAFKSHISEQRCIYSKVVVEYYLGGHAPWQHIKTIEKRVPLTICDYLLDVLKAAFLVSNCKVYQGYAKVEDAGLLRMPGSFIDEQRDLVLHGVLDAKVQSAIVRHGGEEVKRHLRKTLRVQEFVIPEGGSLHVLGAERPVPHGNRQLLSGEMAIADSGEQAVRSYFREKALLGIITGGFLALLALFLFFIFLS